MTFVPMTHCFWFPVPLIRALRGQTTITAEGVAGNRVVEVWVNGFVVGRVYSLPLRPGDQLAATDPTGAREVLPIIIREPTESP